MSDSVISSLAEDTEKSKKKKEDKTAPPPAPLEPNVNVLNDKPVKPKVRVHPEDEAPEKGSLLIVFFIKDKLLL